MAAQTLPCLSSLANGCHHVSLLQPLSDFMWNSFYLLADQCGRKMDPGQSDLGTVIGGSKLYLTVSVLLRQWSSVPEGLRVPPCGVHAQSCLRSTQLLYLCPSLPVEHRPSTTPRHRTLFWAVLAIPDRLVPSCFSSASVSLLQLLRGRPLFLFPCGFQVRAWRVVLDAGFLRVCPIQPHFLRSICLATGSCPARSHRSSFRIFSCHRIL